MAKNLKKLAVWLLTVSMLLSVVAMPAAAESWSSTAIKTNKLLERDTNKYEVEVRVPGEDPEKKHDEVIVMVDGSYSMDEEWEDMKKALVLIGETVLNGSGNTQLTLMSFGVSPNIVLEHVTSVEQLEASLPELPGKLLYGRSATNCDGAFEGIQYYINNHDELYDEPLNEAFVIFLSDGGANTNSQPVDWVATAGTVKKAWAEDAQIDELKHVVCDGATLSEATKTVYGEELETLLEKAEAAFVGTRLGELFTILYDMSSKDPQYKTLTAEFTAEKAASEDYAYLLSKVNQADEAGQTNAQKWVAQAFRDFYAEAGMDSAKPYPVYTAERAYVDYEIANNTYLFNTFYYVMLTASQINHDNVSGAKGYYALEEATRTAAMEEIGIMYVVRYGYDHRSGWMTQVPETVAIQSENVASLCSVLENSLTDLAKTPFNDVVITDYMSKWVNPDVDSLYIVDNSTGETIWSAAEGWLINENRPTDKEPVVVELVDSADYENGGDDVIGNESGDIYKLTWYVKDGAMLRSDTYSLKYEVTVDVEETGFESNKPYPANGNTDLHYVDENGDEQTEKIKVPPVDAELPEPPAPPTISFNNGDASNISFMLIDEATGEVEFLYKVDIENETFFDIPTEEGKVSAVFVKQSTSGMFWTAEEVGETALNNLIECLKANNPSYKGFDAACYGAGDHELEFKDGKFVTYTFTGAAEAGIYDIEHDSYSEPETPAEPEAPVQPEPETPADPQPDDSTDSEEPVLSEKEQKKAKKQEEKAQKEKEKADKKAQKEAKKAEENSEEEIQALDAQILTLDEQIEEISEEIQVIEEEIAAE